MLKRQLYIVEFILAAHVAFCILIEMQSVIHPIQTLSEASKPKLNPHANHNQYFDVFGFFGFAVWILLKYIYEGFRLNSLLIFAAYACFFFDRVLQFADKILCQVSAILTILFIWTLISYPVYALPKPTGKYKVGYKAIRVDDSYHTQVSVYYPCADTKNSTQSYISWLPNSKYAHQLYEIIISKSRIPIPEFLFDIAQSFLGKLKMAVLLDQPIVEQKLPVIVLSHGLTQHQNAYSNLAQQWASEGFAVFCPQHYEMVYPWDQKETKIYQKGTYPELLEKYQKVRQAHLEWRVEQVTYLVNGLRSNKIDFMGLRPTQINLVGHSFGGATAIRVGQEMKVDSIVAIDPWLFPLSVEQNKQQIQCKTIILAKEKCKHDDAFMAHLILDFIEEHPKVEHYKIRGMDHAHSTDLVYYMGSEMQLLGELRRCEDAQSINQAISQIGMCFIAGTQRSQKLNDMLF